MQSRDSFFNTTLEETLFFSSQVQNSLIFNNKNSASFVLITQFLVKKSKQISGQGFFRGGLKWG